MSFLSNLHTHTTFSDGKNTPEEYVQAALRLGLLSLGFSEHVPGSDDCEIPAERMPDYLLEVASLRERYRGRIEIYAGLESDYFLPADPWREKLDYIIGSVHTLPAPDGRMLSVDYLHEDMDELTAYYGAEGMIRLYYRQLCEMAREQRPDILGHFDLITKLNTGKRYFDQDADWYRSIVDEAAEEIAALGMIVEVNTGAMARGNTTQPYPDAYILSRLCALGAPVTISSDAHAANHLTCAFDDAAALLRRIGYKSVKQLRGGSFVDVELELLCGDRP